MQPEFTERGAEAALPPEVLNQRIADFDLRIEGSVLEPVVAELRAELRAAGLTRVEPAFYLTDEWGVPEGTVAVGIPFYLADERLRLHHGRSGGFVEGETPADVLRYLRHEMGHVFNYAYRLHASPEWEEWFGRYDLPYRERYRVRPFDPAFVRHLPGGYAQKHPDEDWSETFAVWLTPGLDWRRLYADAPVALGKLEYCDRTLSALRERDPIVTSVELDYDFRQLETTIAALYEELTEEEPTLPASLETDLRAVLEGSGTRAADRPAGELLAAHAATLVRAAYRFTASDPDRLWRLVRLLQRRVAAQDLRYPQGEAGLVLVGLSALVTALAMNDAVHGDFIPPAR